MYSKWKIRGVDNYVFGEDKELYKLPFKSHGKYYGVRKIKKQYPNRYRINKDWLSERQLKNRLVLDEEPIEIFPNHETPF